MAVDRRQGEVAGGDSAAAPRGVGLPETVRLVVETLAERLVDDQAREPDPADTVVVQAQGVQIDTPVSRRGSYVKLDAGRIEVRARGAVIEHLVIYAAG